MIRWKGSLALFIFVILILFFGIYKFFILGQKDFGLKYDYYYCQNGIYYTYPKGFYDAGAIYYNENDEKLADCPGEGVPKVECNEIHELAGNCTKRQK